MLDRLFGPQTNNLQKALSQTTQRHALLTENLANVNVPGYKRKDIDFGIELETAESIRNGNFPDTALGSPAASKLHASGSITIDGNSVDMEQEVAGIGETELRYELLTELTSRYFGGLKNVIREGR